MIVSFHSCNPITYCFMNSNFRKAFINVFGCSRRKARNQYNMGMSMHNYSVMGPGNAAALRAERASALAAANGAAAPGNQMRETSFRFTAAGRNGDH
jgi:hypothetical protein